MLTEAQKYRIEDEAQVAYERGDAHLDCPYQFGSEEGLHWMACWIIEGGTIPT